MEKKFSIIITYYNNGYKNGFLNKVLWSIYRQTYTNYEIIIVDNNSPVPVIKSDCRDSVIKIYRMDYNYGNCFARNFGLSKASGEYVIFNDGDSVYSSNFLEVHSQTKSDVYITVYDGKFKNFLNCKLDEIQDKVISYEKKYPDTDFKTLHNPDISHFLNCNPAAISFKRKILLEDTYDESFSYNKDFSKGRGWEDLELNVRLYKKGCIFSGSKDAFTAHIAHDCAIKSIAELVFASKINWDKLNKKHSDFKNICPKEWYSQADSQGDTTAPRRHFDIFHKSKPTIGIYGVNSYIGGTETSLVELAYFIENEMKDFNVWIAQMDGRFVSELDPLIKDFGLNKLTLEEASKAGSETDIIIYYADCSGRTPESLKVVKSRVKMFGGILNSLANESVLVPTHYWIKTQEILDWLHTKVSHIDKSFMAQTPINIDYWNNYNQEYVNEFKKLNNIKANALIIGTVARNEKLNETIKLIKSFAFSNVELLVVGTNDKIPGCITFGRIPARNIYQLMDIFLYNSTADGVPRVIMEAMCNSLPIVSSNIGGIPSLGHKYFIDNNFEDFRDTLEKLIKSKDLRLSIGKENYNSIIKYNDVSKKNIAQFLRSLL